MRCKNQVFSFLFRLAFVLLLMTSAITRASENVIQGEEQIYRSEEPELGFSIRVPPQWLVQAGRSGYAVVLTPSENVVRLKLPGGLEADPTITVAASKKPIVIDEKNLNNYAEEIVEKFKSANGPNSDFNIFQKSIVEDLPDGRRGFLYYVSYKSDGSEVGQAIFVTGHNGGRYRVTLSDHRLNFDRNLELYYPYMTSIKFSVPVEKSGIDFDSSILSWGLLVILSGIVVGFIAKRNRVRDGKGKYRQRLSNRESALQRVSSNGLANATSSDEELGSVPTTSVNQTSPLSEMPESRSVSGSVTHFNTMSSDPAFSAEDLSAPPESVPLSHVVDENAAPSQIKKKWTIRSSEEKENPKAADDRAEIKKYS